MNKLTETRLKQLEKLLRSLRFNNPALYGERGELKEKQSERLITLVKARLMPTYDKRAYETRDRLFKKQYEIDTAINYRGL